VLKKIILSGFGLVLIGLSRFGFNAVALNVFGEDASGALNIALSLAILAALPVTTAFGATTVRFIAAARGEGYEDTASWLFRGLFVATIVVMALTTITLFASRDAVATNRGIPTILVVEALVVAVGYGLYQFFRNVLYAVDAVEAYSRLELVAAVGFFGTLAIAATIADTALLTAYMVGYGAFVLGAFYTTRSRWGVRCPPERRTPIGPLASFSAFAFIGSMSSLGTREIAVLLAPDVTDLAGVAHIGLCISLLTPLQFMPRMLRTVVFAQSAEQAGRGERDALAQSISDVSHWLLIVNIPLCTTVALLAGPILSIVGGSPTADHVLVLRLLTAVAAFEILATPATNALPGAGNIRVPAWSAVIGLIAAVLIWSSQGSLLALCLGLLASAVLKGGIPVIVAWRELGLRLTHAPLVVAGLIVVSAVALAADGALPPFAMAALYLVIAAAIAAGQLGTGLRMLQARRARRAAP